MRLNCNGVLSWLPDSKTDADECAGDTHGCAKEASCTKAEIVLFLDDFYHQHESLRTIPAIC